MGSFTVGGGGIAIALAGDAVGAPGGEGSACATADTEANKAKRSASFRMNTQ